MSVSGDPGRTPTPLAVRSRDTGEQVPCALLPPPSESPPPSTDVWLLRACVSCMLARMCVFAYTVLILKIGDN